MRNWIKPYLVGRRIAAAVLFHRVARFLATRLNLYPRATREADGHPEYATRLRQEIAAFRTIENVHDLPDVFHIWSHRYVRSNVCEVFNVERIDEFYAKYILKFAGENPGALVEIASLGVGNGDTEVGLGTLLHQKGFSNFHFRCVDVNPDMLARGRRLAAAAGLSGQYSFEEVDAAEWHVERPLGVVIANQSLHHFVHLEAILANIKAAIGSGGYFLSNDMIGRNGHQLWPEALSEVHEIWREMPDRYKYNHQLKRFEEQYENWDCSVEGFEGIRAQDILPLLLKTFHFEGFAAYSNIANIFVSRGFGHNFDPKNLEDVAFIERIGALDETLIDQGVIKPCQMTAAMRALPVAQPKYYRHWTAEFCMRDPTSDSIATNLRARNRNVPDELQRKQVG